MSFSSNFTKYCSQGQIIDIYFLLAFLRLIFILIFIKYGNRNKKKIHGQFKLKINGRSLILILM
jgi:hypothetical protein